MSYHVYTTEGIILKRTPFGEANILLHIFTKDLGLIIASARSARLSVSKLRTALQEGSFVIISCVKGKGGWKVTNATYQSSLFFDLPEYTHKVVAQVFKMLLKMIVGESPDSKTFEVVSSGFNYLKKLQEDNTTEFEILMVLRILNRLGYIAKDENTEIFFDEACLWDYSLLEKIDSEKTKIVSVINKALKESQL
jgi:DNA repair protein RecO